MVINVEIDPFFVFSADGSKKSVTVWKKYLCTTERSHLALQENVAYFFHFCISRPSEFSSMPVNKEIVFLHKII